MQRFRPDNTEGYSASDLAALNEAFETIMSNSPPLDAEGDSIEFKSWQDDVAAKLLVAYDAGERGAALTS